jgi:hypothetical protein
MVNDNTYFLFHATGDRRVTINLFQGLKCKKTFEIAPPDTISETVWKYIPQWLSNKKTINTLSGIGYIHEQGTYSTVRTLLSIINTLGIVENVPVAILKKGDRIQSLINELTKHALFEIEASYT